MSKLRSIILLTLCVVSMAAWGQRRYSTSDRRERSLAKVRGFSTRDVDNKTDAFLGLHASLYDGAHHLVGFSIDGGWSTFFNNVPGLRMTPGGGAASAKLLYEYQFGHLFIQTGLGVGYQNVTTPVTDSLVSKDARIFYHDMIDPLDGAKFRMKHVFDHRVDNAEQYYAQLPVNLGYYIVGTGGIGFVMLGVQVNYAFMGRTTMKANCTSSADFEKYMGIFEEIDRHGMRKDVPITCSAGQLKTKIDVAGHIEGGYEFNTFQAIREYRVSRSDHVDCRMRFSAFADISLLNTCAKGEVPMYDLNVAPGETNQAKLQGLYDFHSFKMNHVLSTEVANSGNLWVRNLTVGLRFTLLFSMQTKEHCILCDPWRH